MVVGERPGNCPGECQLDSVDVDSCGEASSLTERPLVLWLMVGAVLGTISMDSGSFLRCPRCFSSMFSKPSLVKGFGKTSFMPDARLTRGTVRSLRLLTMLEVHGDVVGSDVGSHCDDGSRIELTD